MRRTHVGSSGSGNKPAAANTTSGSFGLLIAISGSRRPAKRNASACPRAADSVAAFPLAPPTGGSLPAPHERRRGRVPVPGHRLEPADDLADVLRVLARQGPPLEDPLHALGHVQPRPAHGRI